MKRKDRITITLDSKTVKILRGMGINQTRSLSNIIEVACNEYIKSELLKSDANIKEDCCK